MVKKVGVGRFEGKKVGGVEDFLMGGGGMGKG
jgi:hypothetical protein